MYETKQYFYGTGRRKHSVARVRVYNGTGKITINNRDIDDYFGLETLKLMVRSPLALTNTDGKFDIVINVVGGGTSGQAGAIRHGLSRALLDLMWKGNLCYQQKQKSISGAVPRLGCRGGALCW